MIKNSLKIVWDLDPSEEKKPLLDWLEACGWCWGISVPWHADSSRLRIVRERGWCAIKEFHAHPGTRKRESKFKKKPLPELETVISEALTEAGEDLIWQILLEDDSSGVGFPQVLMKAAPKRHAEAQELFDRYLRVAMDASKPFDVLERWGVCGFASSAHAYARHGVDCVIVERANDDVEDLQTAIAFARGASKQYGCQWGIDFSLWWGVLYGCIQNLPVSFHKRHFWVSALSGAQVFRMEGGSLFWDERNGGPTLLGEAFHPWASQAQSLNWGETEVPVALLLPKDHGWITPPYWRSSREAWNYARIPYRPGEKGIDGFFGAAFPGSIFAMDPFPAGSYQSEEIPASPFALSCVTPQFATKPEDIFQATSLVPFGRFKDRQEAREFFHEEKLDPAFYRTMGDSRWGDVFDVLTDEVTWDVISLYQVVVVLGPVKMAERLKTNLISYVQAGGTLIVAAGVVTPGDEAWTGVSFQPELRVGRAWRWKNDALRHEAFRYCPLNGELEDRVEVMARSRTGDPLLVSCPMGEGRVLTCLIPWFEGGHIDLAGPALSLFDSVLNDVIPVSVIGPPAEWLTTVSKECRNVLVCNHDSTIWRGDVIVRGDPARRVRLEIGPHDLRVLQFAEGGWRILEL